jgi:3-isopropylmalate/(R)-2-methylmalate dehydratase small subunit
MREKFSRPEITPSYTHIHFTLPHMALEKITHVSGTAAVFPGDDIDTDRIIPARFMKCITFDGLGEFLFYDVRFDANGNPTSHVINRPEFAGAKILIGGSNFGCGSSREHAPQAIYRYGYRAVIAEGFAEIFFGNSTTLGMPCVVMSPADLEMLRGMVMNDPKIEIAIDISAKTVTADGKTFAVEMRESARDALINGRWDAIGELLDGAKDVDAVAGKLPYMAA